MLWSDLRDEPSEEARALRARLVRAGRLIAVAMVAAAVLLLR
ncbi:hypothetical protein GCM10009716_14690 [Streptomyces sodiiphilus]|uniref:Uncharacterized protein n=1 Tax=Streptomyces sodiiphilus TaxID=226217 RepID=A0ABP5A890_9ACTN